MPEFYPIVPKDPVANLYFRQELVRLTTQGAKGEAEIARRDQRRMCEEDPLYWLNAWGFTYDPRPNATRMSGQVPFITWPYQDTALLAMIDAIRTGQDVVVEKSRDMGASWLVLAAVCYMWQFQPYQSFLLASRKEDYVDQKGNPDTLFWKLDFLLEKQPQWLTGPFTRKSMHMEHLGTRSTINGESTNNDLGRGGRRTAILLDEFAAVENGNAVLSSTADVTNCRIFASTPKGSGNAFYQVAHNKNIVKVRMHWTLHPHKAAGLYVFEGGALKRLDQTYAYPADYSFILDGKTRSPWYDAEVRRRSSPVEVAQELDIDYIGSGAAFFDQTELFKHQELYVRDPVVVGELDLDERTAAPIGIVERAQGKISCWCVLAEGRPPPGSYVIGVDVSNGTGASNSAISIVDRATQEKVAEFVSSTVKPEHLAVLTVALCRLFYDAYLIWEANGPGRPFGNRVLELGYRNIYYRRAEASLTKKSSDFPGFYSTRDTKVEMLTAYRRALQSGEFVNRSLASLLDARGYVYDGTGGVSHVEAMHAADASGAREAHGDRAIADALVKWAIASVTPSSSSSANADQEQTPEIRPGSLAWRRREADAKAQARTWW